MTGERTRGHVRCLARVLDRYVSRSGPLLANGLAYRLLFAFFAGVWIAVSVFGLIMVGNIDWQQMLIDAVVEVIPGVADSLLTSSALAPCQAH